MIVRDPHLPDEAARPRSASELDTTLLVEAAAGTGKTESLVERMVGLIRRDARRSTASPP